MRPNGRAPPGMPSTVGGVLTGWSGARCTAPASVSSTNALSAVGVASARRGASVRTRLALPERDFFAGPVTTSTVSKLGRHAHRADGRVRWVKPRCKGCKNLTGRPLCCPLVKAIRRFSVRTVLPSRIEGLGVLASHLRGSRPPPTPDLFDTTSRPNWAQAGEDPVKPLSPLSSDELATLAADDG